ncbi:hypothetical protein EJ02DRAFT_512102 [Clathrospora elynae]|uniref:Ubiquitin 3 binding protein But2 C-terminal domain-containing protein n=1 Tax=Clathrospora elynae TaxID=706981 RepID=A0A6A5STP0_9PLEO|nr:hypothetical protein EJ02DRAFT_512102 [Clathrospora elynae]
MLSTTSSLFATLFLGHAFGFPYPLPNSTIPSPTNSTICNSTATLCNGVPAAVSPPPLGSGEYVCHEVYPTELTIVNSRYPDYTVDHLHQANQFFMLRRQLAGDGEIATIVQFNGLPNSTSNYTCRLEFVLPRQDLQRISGPNPSFNVYQVEQDIGPTATWNTYKDDKTSLYGTVNGDNEALERTRSVGGVAAVNEMACNETLTFQMGLMHDSMYNPNYWEFSEVAPPAWPVQGFRIVYGC